MVMALIEHWSKVGGSPQSQQLTFKHGTRQDTEAEKDREPEDSLGSDATKV